MSQRPVQDQTYKGFSTPTAAKRPAGVEPPPVRSRPRNWRAAAWLAGLLLLVALGVGLGHQLQRLRQPPAEVASSDAAATIPALGPLAPTPPAGRAEPAAPIETRSIPIRSLAAPAVQPTPALTTPTANAGPAFACRGQLRRSERMVCADPELSALDRRLNRAFNAAVRAGAPRAQLRAEQDSWVFEREAVARRSQAELVGYYRQRVAELEALSSTP